MLEARKCIEILEQPVKNSESISLSAQTECQDAYKAAANTNNPLSSLVNNLSINSSAFGSLLLKGYILGEGENKKINSPSEIVTRFTNQLSLKRRRQILAVSYLIDLEIRELSRLDLNYIKKTLEDMRNDIDES